MNTTALSSPFTARFKPLVLFAPAFLFVLAVIDAIFAGPSTRTHAFELLVIIFATAPHIVLTIPLAGHPEVTRMIRERTNGRPWLFWRAVPVAFAIGISLFAIAESSLSVGEDGLVVARLLLEVLAFHHGLRQMSGIAMLYNSRLKRERELSPASLARMNGIQKFERLVFYQLTIFFCLFRAVDLLTAAHAFLPVARVLAFVPCLLLLGSAVRTWQLFRDTEKLVYFSRLVVIGLIVCGVFSTFLAPCFLAFHAIEYFGVYDRIRSRSQATPAERNRIFWLAVGSVALTLPLYFVNHVDGLEFFLGAGSNSILIPIALKSLASIEGGCDFVHYWLDRQIFRMRIMEVRKHVAPLFSDRAA